METVIGYTLTYTEGSRKGRLVSRTLYRSKGAARSARMPMFCPRNIGSGEDAYDRDVTRRLYVRTKADLVPVYVKVPA